jgi:hypothetical protein
LLFFSLPYVLSCLQSVHVWHLQLPEMVKSDSLIYLPCSSYFPRYLLVPLLIIKQRSPIPVLLLQFSQCLLVGPKKTSKLLKQTHNKWIMMF